MMKRHAVVLLVASFQSNAERVARVVGLARGLAGRGHRVALWAVEGEGADFEGIESAIDVRAFGGAGGGRGGLWGRFLSLRRALKRFRGGDVVVIQSHDPITDLLAPCLSRRLCGCFVVSSRLEARSARGAVYALSQRVVGRWVSRVFVGSESASWAMVYREGLARDRVEVIGAGVDAERFRPAVTPLERSAREKLRESLGVSADEQVLIVVGALEVSKGHGAAIAVTSRLLRSGHRVRLWLVGDGGDAALFDAQAGREGVEAQVSFLGSREDLADLLRAADLFLLTSHMEDLSVSLLEAMASGLPVVATDVAGSREAVGEAGGVVTAVNDVEAMAEAAAALLSDPERRRSLGASARGVVLSRYTSSHMVDRVIGGHRTLIHGDAGPEQGTLR